MSIINTKNSRSQRSFVSLFLALAIVASLWFVNPADDFRKVQSQSPCDWLMFGKALDGSRVVGSDCVRDVQKLEKMWSLDNIQSTPVVWGDRLYCNTYDYVCCFNANTGATIWKYKTDSYYGYPPVFADGRIYFQYYTFRSNNSSILCLDALSGNEIWSYFTETTGQLLKVHNKKLFYNSKDFITCVDAITLKTLWAYKKSYISDFFIANGKVYTKPLVCLDADTGKVVWQTDRKYSSVFSINDGKIYLSTLTDDRKPILNCYNADSGTLLWSMPIDPNAGYPVEAVSIWDNRIFFRVCDYYGKNLNSILCYDLDAKKLLWKIDLGVDIPGALTHLGSNIITGSSSGKLFFISADTGKITRQTDFDGSIAWEIVAVQEKVYINASDTLHCLGIKPQIANSNGQTIDFGLIFMSNFDLHVFTKWQNKRRINVYMENLPRP